MNDRMSYNDVEQLKRQIKARLGGTVNDVMNIANQVAQGAIQQFQGASPQMQSSVGAPQMRSSVSTPQMNRQGQPMRSQNPQPQAMQSSMTPPPQMRSSMIPPPPMKAQNMTPPPMAGGAHFEKYSCGHDYPRMSMKQHIKSELDADDMIKRTDNLRYAVVMAEVLGEPVSRRRRRKRSLSGQSR